MGPDSDILKKISEYTLSLQLNEISDDVKWLAKRCLIDVFGVILAGTKTHSAKVLQGLAYKNYSLGNCDILGSNTKLNPAGAAFANSSSAHALDFDDNCYAGIVHGSAVVFPSVLAMAQERNLNGKDLLLGFIAGLEVELTIAKALSNSIYDKGWWTTSMLGAIGSAAGAAKIAGLDSKTIKNALSLAAVGCGATRAVRGTSAKHFYCGRAAESGVTAVFAAMEGITGPANVFQDNDGIAEVLNDGFFDVRPFENLGTEYCIANPGIDLKKYPVCFASHSCIDAVKEICENNKFKSSDVASINCLVPPVVATNLTYHEPKNVAEAQFSLNFAIATILLHGDLKLENLFSEPLFGPITKTVAHKVKMKVGGVPKKFRNSKNICPEWGYVELTTKDGSRKCKFVGSPLGSASFPMSKELLKQKFEDCCDYGGFSASAEKLYKQISQIELLSDTRDLMLGL